MSNQFKNGYALLIGVDENAVPKWSLPDVIKDIDAFRTVLTNSKRCAYPENHVKSLTGNEATRDNILDGLAWLQDRVKADKSGNATVVVYYTGHGWRDDEQEPPDYYLIPYDVNEYQLTSRALRASEFAAAIKGLNSQRLQVIMDCCHSGGMGVKDLSFLPKGYALEAVPSSIFMGAEKAVPIANGVKGLEELTKGAGRAVINSSQASQLSYIRRDGKMSIFTYHLIEALTGHAEPKESATEVLVTDVMSYVYRKVPKSAEADCGEEQFPDCQLSGNFPVALLLGGKGLPKGEIPPDPLDQIKPIGSPTRQRTDTAIIFNQPGQRIGRDQLNFGNVNRGFINIGTSVGRNFHQVNGDFHAGNRYEAGRDIHQTNRELSRMFEDVLKRVMALPAEEQRVVKPAVESVRDQVTEIQQSGIEDETSPQYGILERSLKTLVEWVPDIAEVVLDFLKNPTTGIVSAVQKLAERIKSKMK